MKTRYKLIIFLISLGCFSCDDLLETVPTEQVSTELTLSSFTGLRSLVIEGYNDLLSGNRFGSAFYVQPELMGDNTTFLDNRGTYEFHWRNTLRTHVFAWNNYNPINDLTLVLENIPIIRETGGPFTESDLNNLEGQARALRAFYYFFTVNVYAYTPTAIIEEQNQGGIPILENGVTALSNIDFEVGRSSIEDVYAFIKSDLNQAISLLDDNNSASNNNTFIGKTAAQALLSRVSLYNGDWQEVVDLATEVIAADQATLSTYDNYGQDWGEAFHPESLFTIFFGTADNIGVNTSIASIYSPEDGGFGDYVPNNTFLSLLNTNDARRQLLGDTNADGIDEYRKMTSDAGSTFLDHISVIRLSEVYLNRAEAYAQMNQTTEAIADLDLLRMRSLGADFVATASSGDQLIDDILLERRLELAFEGHRWFDLKRTGSEIDKRDVGGLLIPFNDPRILAPIPAGDIAINSNLSQNDGY